MLSMLLQVTSTTNTSTVEYRGYSQLVFWTGDCLILIDRIKPLVYPRSLVRHGIVNDAENIPCLIS